jgi:hypothetical protein
MNRLRSHIAVAAALAAVLITDVPLPVPPVPPARPRGPDLAPMPDRDAGAPSRAEARGVAIAPQLFNPPRQFQGDGYAPGSTVQSVQERQIRPTPGVQLSVPLN